MSSKHQQGIDFSVSNNRTHDIKSAVKRKKNNFSQNENKKCQYCIQTAYVLVVFSIIWTEEKNFFFFLASKDSFAFLFIGHLVVEHLKCLRFIFNDKWEKKTKKEKQRKKNYHWMDNIETDRVAHKMNVCIRYIFRT